MGGGGPSTPMPTAPPPAGGSDGDDSEAMAGAEQCLPLSMLAQPDAQEQMQTPAVGDSGTMTVDYTVTRVEGDNAYIKPSAINGQPIGPEEGEGTPGEEDQDAQEGSDLRDQAQQMSQTQ